MNQKKESVIGLKVTAKEFVLPSFGNSEEEEYEYDTLCVDETGIEYDKIEDCLTILDNVEMFYFDNEDIEDIITDLISESKSDKKIDYNKYIDDLNQLYLEVDPFEMERAKKIVEAYKKKNVSLPQ
jgi:hypothetical protein